MSLVIAPTMAYSRREKNGNPQTMSPTHKAIIVDKKICGKVPAGGANKNRFHGNGPKHAHDLEAIHKGVQDLEENARNAYVKLEFYSSKPMVYYPVTDNSSNNRLRILSQL